MKFCPKCGNQISDDAMFCPFCGSNFQQDGQAAQQPQQPGAPAQAYYPPQPAVNYIPPYDHTQEFDAKDISDNKVFAMLIYLMSVFGVIIGLLAAQNSPYVGFHIRQALKFTVIDILVGLIAVVLFWTFIVPIAALVVYAILWVVRIICFVQICQGKAVEPVIIRSLGFLK